MKKILFIGFLFLTFGCAKDYYTDFQNEKKVHETGSLVIVLTEPMQNVNVTINDNIVAQNKHTEKIVVNNLSPGSYKVNVLGYENDRNDLKETFVANITSDNKTEKLLQTPSLSNWRFVKTGLTIAATATLNYILVFSNKNFLDK